MKYSRLNNLLKTCFRNTDYEQNMNYLLQLYLRQKVANIYDAWLFHTLNGRFTSANFWRNLEVGLSDT